VKNGASPISLVLAVAMAACGSSSEGSTEAPAVLPGAGGDPSPPASSAPPTATATPPTSEAKPIAPPRDVVVVTFNTGMHDIDKNDDFGSNKAKTVGDYYGSGLAWGPAIVESAAWLKTVDADIIGLQEIFDPEECPTIPADKQVGLVCDGWKLGDPSVAQRLVGAGYQIACHVGHHDICAAVKLSFGKFKGCSGALCPDGLGGVQIPNCGHGGRVGRGVIELAAGGTITLASVHGSSGFDLETIDCRKKQFDQIFVSLDGTPAANGTTNIVLGDFNTDPGRLRSVDASAQALADAVGGGKPFHFVSDVGSSAAPTYVQTLLPLLPAGVNIDLVASDKLKGSCWTAGVTAGHPALGAGYYDHKPHVCTLNP
jgi:hypothetical protein